MNRFLTIPSLITVMVFFSWALPEPSQALTTIDVTTTADVVDANDGVISLREAIAQVDADTDVDHEYVINLEGGMTYALTDQSGSYSSLQIFNDEYTLTINGNGGGLGQATIVGTGGQDSPASDIGIFDFIAFMGPHHVTLNDLVITGGKATNLSFGGAIKIFGPGALVPSSLVLNRCYLYNNSAKYEGGALSIEWMPEVKINNTTIASNSSDLDVAGGVAMQSGRLYLTNSTVSGNSAYSIGGGIYFFNGDEFWIRNSTIYNNTADLGGGVAIADGFINIKNSILSGNSATTAGPDCNNHAPVSNPSTFVSEGYNILGTIDASCASSGAGAGDQIGINDPVLSALADNGGPAPTHAELTGSPALDNGDPSGCTDADGNLLNYDERGPGFPREEDGNNDGVSICDSGAFELASTFSEIDDAIGDLMDNVAAIPVEDFGNGNKQDATLNKLDAIQEQFNAIQTETDPAVRAQLINSLENKLTNDLLAKGDGCEPAPDNNDWIIDCDSQAIFQATIQEMLDLLETL